MQNLKSRIVSQLNLHGNYFLIVEKTKSSKNQWQWHLETAKTLKWQRVYVTSGSKYVTISIRFSPAIFPWKANKSHIIIHILKRLKTNHNGSKLYLCYSWVYQPVSCKFSCNLVHPLSLKSERYTSAGVTGRHYNPATNNTIIEPFPGYMRREDTQTFHLSK